jgi:PhnB protein
MAARAGFTTLFPYILVTDAAPYIEFLVQGLGGVEIDRSVHDGRIANCQIRFGDTTIMVGEGSAEFPPSQLHLYFYVDDADAAVARALEHGGSLISAVGDRPYGDRQGGIADPAGNIWWMSQPLTEAYPKESAI